MKIVVSKDIVKIENNHSENHYGEYNVNECTFQFDDYFNNVSVKRTIFTSRIDNKSIEVDIINNKCMVPSEILKNVYDEVTLGVYGYELSGEELLVRYSPTPDKFVVHDGSYKENAEHPEIITPSQYDIYSQALQEGLDRVYDKLVDVEKQGEYANTQGDYAKEQGDYAKEQGTNAKNVADDTQKKAEEGAFNGKSLEFIWQGTKLGVRLEGQEEYQFVDLQGVQGEIGATGEPFKIKKTYASVSEMNADFRNMAFGDYVMIASSVDVEDNAKLYTRGESAWIFISDFSGAMGIRGETGLTPNIKIGEVKTLEAGSQAKVTRSGSNEEPVFNFELPKGDKGDDYVLTEEDKVEIGEKVNTEYEKRIAENEKDIVDIESYLDSLTPKATAKGELVHITDALGLPMFETKTSGNVKQETTTGKNIFNGTGWRYIQSGNGFPEPATGATIVSSDTNNISFTSTQWAYAGVESGFIKVKANETYIFSATFTTPTNRLFITQYDESKTRISTLNYSSVTTLANKIFTTTSDGYITIAFANTTTAQTTYKIENIQIEKGSTATDYEPYTGGQASPNSEYPQDIEVLEGYQLFDKNNANILYDTYIGTAGNVGSALTNNILYLEIKPNTSYTIQKISSNRFRVGTYNNLDVVGKTLNNIITNLNDSITSYTLKNTTDKYLFFQYLGGDKNEQEILDSIIINEGIDKKTYLPYGCVGYKVNGKNLCKEYNGYKASTDGIKANTTFTISFDVVKKMTDFVYLHDINGTYKGDFSSTTLDVGHHSKTFTLPYDFSFFRNYRTGEEITNVQIEIGQETPYEPYQEQIVPLDLKGNWVGKINDNIKDYLVTDKKRLWLVKNVGKVVLNGSEDIIQTDTNTTGIKRFLVFTQLSNIVKLNSGVATGNLLSNRFYVININDTYVLKQGIAYGLSNNVYGDFVIYSDLTKEMTVDEFKQWLSENNVEVYYQLAEPQIIELGELPEPIKTFEGTNNIQVLANLDTEIEVKYALDLKKYYDNKLAEISAQII